MISENAENDLLDRFLARLSGRTRENYAGDVDLWRRWLTTRDTDLTQVTRQDVEEYLVERREQGLRPRTISTILSHLRGFYRWALQEEAVASDPTALVRGPARGRSAERVWLGRADLARLLDTSLTWSGGELAAHVHLWALSGLRPGEPRTLRVEDLATHDGATTLAVTATKTPGRERIVLPAATAHLLASAAAGRRRGTLLIHPRTGRPWTMCTERGRLHRLLDDAGLPPVTAYGLRTSFITLALEAGIDERLVMISARHSSSAQTARYDRMRDQVTRAVGPALERWLSSPQDPTRPEVGP